MKTKKLTNKPLVVKLDFNRHKETGMSNTAMKQFINKSVKFLISHSDDKAIIKESIRLATKIGQKKSLNQKDFDAFNNVKNSLGKFVRDRKNNDYLFMYGGRFSQASMNNTVLTKKDISKKELKNLKKLGVLNKTQLAQFSQVLKKGGGVKRNYPSLDNIRKGLGNTRKIQDAIDIIENMGGFIVALDKYFEDVERIADSAGLDLDEFNKIYFGDENDERLSKPIIVYKIFYPFWDPRSKNNGK